MTAAGAVTIGKKMDFRGKKPTTYQFDYIDGNIPECACAVYKRLQPFIIF